MHDVIKKGPTMTFLSGLLASYGWLACYGGRSIRSLLIGSDTVNEASDTFLSVCVLGEGQFRITGLYVNITLGLTQLT